MRRWCSTEESGRIWAACSGQLPSCLETNIRGLWTGCTIVRHCPFGINSTGIVRIRNDWLTWDAVRVMTLSCTFPCSAQSFLTCGLMTNGWCHVCDWFPSQRQLSSKLFFHLHSVHRSDSHVVRMCVADSSGLNCSSTKYHWKKKAKIERRVLSRDILIKDRLMQQTWVVLMTKPVIQEREGGWIIFLLGVHTLPNRGCRGLFRNLLFLRINLLFLIIF